MWKKCHMHIFGMPSIFALIVCLFSSEKNVFFHICLTFNVSHPVYTFKLRCDERYVGRNSALWPSLRIFQPFPFFLNEWLFKFHTESTEKNQNQGFQSTFSPRYREVNQYLTYFLPIKHTFCTFWPTFQLTTSRWPTYRSFFTYGLAFVHFDFQVWDSNPHIQSKSAQNLLGNNSF